MAKNNLGLGLTITAQDMASAIFRRVGRAAKGMQATMMKVGAGIGLVGSAIKQSAMAFAPFALAAGAGVKTAASFEKGMKSVQAVLLATDEDMVSMSAKAKSIGATTKFSAVEAADGFQFLSRAGFTAEQSIVAIDSVVSAAAADNLDLATATNVVATAVRGMGLEAEDAARAANVLALVSARTNTDMVGLGEGMKFSAPIARDLGISIEDTALSLGLLANAGLKGTVGGTAFKNMLLKLAKPTTKGAALIKKFGIETKKANGDMLSLPTVLANVTDALPKMGGNMDKVATLTEIFGLRGEGAAANLSLALEQLGPEKVAKLREEVGTAATMFDGLGAAGKMAEIQMQSLDGQMTILGSSIEGITIAVFEPFLKGMASNTKGMSTWVGNVATGIDMLTAFKGGSKTAMGEFNKLPQSTQDAAMGISEAIDIIKDTIDDVKAAFSSVRESIESVFGPANTGDITKFIVLFGAAAAAIALVAIAIVVIGFVLGPIITLITGLGTIAAAMFSPWGLAIAGIVLLFYTFRDSIWDFVVSAKAALMPFMDPIAAHLGEVWDSLKRLWAVFVGIFSDGVGDLTGSGEEFGSSVGKAIGTVALVIVKVIANLAELVAALAEILPIAGLVKIALIALGTYLAIGAVMAIGGFIASIASAVMGMGTYIVSAYATATASGAATFGITAIGAAMKGMIASSALALGPLGAVAAAATAIFVAGDQALKLIDELSGGGLDTMLLELQHDLPEFLGGISDAEYQSRLGIVTGDDYDKQYKGPGSKAAFSAVPDDSSGFTMEPASSAFFEPAVAAPAARGLPSAAFETASSAFAGAPASAEDIAAAMSGVQQMANIEVSSVIKMDGAKFGEAVEKKVIELDNKRGR